MKQNPIYRRETMVRARSFRLALVPLMFNGILALVALLNLYSTLGQVKLTAEIQYSSFLISTCSWQCWSLSWWCS